MRNFTANFTVLIRIDFVYSNWIPACFSYSPHICDLFFICHTKTVQRKQRAR